MLGTQAAVAVENARLLANLTQSNAELTQANQLKSEFLALVSHELRTPMNAITGYTEMLTEGFYGPLPDEMVDPLNRVQRNGKHLLTLINDVLDLSMLEAGHLHLGNEPCHVGTVIEEICQEARPQAQTRGLALHSTIAPHLPAVNGDAQRLHQILRHLVSNAIKFTETGSVSLTAAVLDRNDLRSGGISQGDVLCVTVADTGIGIPDEFRDIVFDPFRQVDGSATRRYSGIGVGLTVVRRLVTLMGGQIELHSEVGVGSTFRILLPVAPAER
jgi:signal transduction histidine kinase